MNFLISEERSSDLVERIVKTGMGYVYDKEKHKITIYGPTESDKHDAVVHFRLPITLPWPSHPEKHKFDPFRYVLVIIQSGQCAVGLFDRDENIDHKVFRAYMVRKKQGKSQIKYLKTKGKSRAGSRVRLAETIEFFENINVRLKEYFTAYDIDLIGISCSKTLIPFLYNSKIATPFEKKDERIYKIPKHIPSPTYEALLEVMKFLLKGELIFEEEQRGKVDDLLNL